MIRGDAVLEDDEVQGVSCGRRWLVGSDSGGSNLVGW